MKKIRVFTLLCSWTLAFLPDCNSNITLNSDSPATLTMWRVYGEQSDLPMKHIRCSKALSKR